MKGAAGHSPPMFEWLAHTWWTYGTSPKVVYHWFNLAEGCFWLWCGALVFARYLKHRRSLEFWYALSFVPFAASDFREAYVLQTWLILAKGVKPGGHPLPPLAGAPAVLSGAGAHDVAGRAAARAVKRRPLAADTTT